MLRKNVILLLMLFSILTSAVLASDADYYISAGRSLMFDGTLSGLRLAYETFENGLNDPDCPDCSDNRELILLHVITRMTMWAGKDDGDPVDSAIEYARQFDIEVLGDIWQALIISYDPNAFSTNQHDAYEIPENAPEILDGISSFFDTSVIPEIDAVMAELDSIDDSPGDRFRIFFTPEETSMFFTPGTPALQNDIEVDYAEVLFLKGLLIALKGQIQARQAYDMYVDPEDMLIEKLYGGTFNINDDLLGPYPDLLKVLPTANDPNDGAAILAQSRENWINAINYYLDGMEYIRSENEPPGTDPQEDELLYVDPNDEYIADAAGKHLIAFRDSLENDTILARPIETTKTFDIYDSGAGLIGQLILVYNFLGFEGSSGSLIFFDGGTAPTPWEMEWFDVDGTGLFGAELEYYEGGVWRQGYFEAMMSNDNAEITNGTFDYWGFSSGTLNNLTGQLTETVVNLMEVDFNPIYGSSPRYPDPLSLRDMLPEFDQWNAALPETIGHGLGDDATLGGILPWMTQYDWRLGMQLQPGGLFYLSDIYPWQKGPGGYAGIWLNEQIVYSDVASDTWSDEGTTGNLDIEKLYLGVDELGLYGHLAFFDDDDWSTQNRTYDLYMSYTPDDKSTLDSLKLQIRVNDEYVEFDCYQMVYNFGRLSWMDYSGNGDARITDQGIDFKLRWEDIPAYLPGRFISLEAEGHDGNWDNWNGEENRTHLQMGRLGTISGTVSYNGYIGAPIFVHAYTDLKDPDGSIVATTMLTEPGPYTLEGIGLGWEGCVRAFTLLFGFNVLDLGSLDIEKCVSGVSLWSEDLDGVDIVLSNPLVLQKDIWEFGDIDADTAEEDWYAFDAVAGGTYTLDLARDTAVYACLTLCGRDGDRELETLEHWQTQQINWLCPVSGRYYVTVADDYQGEGETYQIRMSSDITLSQADIACEKWVGVKDGKVDIYDLAATMSNWLNTCSEPYWCDDSDFDRSGSIDLADFATIGSQWMEDIW